MSCTGTEAGPHALAPLFLFMKRCFIKFGIRTAVTWDVKPYSLVNKYQRWKAPAGSSLQGMEATASPQTF
jgi:hypothetical protein